MVTYENGGVGMATPKFDNAIPGVPTMVVPLDGGPAQMATPMY